MACVNKICILIFCSSYEVRSLIACRVLVCRGALGALPIWIELVIFLKLKIEYIEHINISFNLARGT